LVVRGTGAAIVDETIFWRRPTRFALEFAYWAVLVDAKKLRRFNEDRSLDYLVAGLGFGALLVLAGYATREFGLFLFVPTRVRKAFPDNPSLANGWQSLCGVTSNVAMAGGLTMWLALVVAIALSLSDQAGAYLVASVATVASIAGAAVVFVAFHRLHQSVVPVHADTSAAEAGWMESEVRIEDSAEPFEAWKPRLLPKAVAAETPASRPADERRTLDEEPIAAADVSNVVATATPPSAEAGIEGPPPASVPADDPISVVNADVPPAAVDATHVETVERAETMIAPTQDLNEAEPAASEASPAAAPGANEPEPTDELISERVGTDAASVDAGVGTGARRFKSSLLSDLDEPGTADANPKFKSSILADLSAVRLPGDGPRFGSTALVDLTQPDEAEVDPSDSNGVTTRRR